MTDTERPTPDPRDPAAVEYAAALMARSNVLRVNPGEVVTVRPSRFERYGIAYAVNRLTTTEREWLEVYQREAARKRRADREEERRARRERRP